MTTAAERRGDGPDLLIPSSSRRLLRTDARVFTNRSLWGNYLCVSTETPHKGMAAGNGESKCHPPALDGAGDMRRLKRLPHTPPPSFPQWERWNMLENDTPFRQLHVQERSILSPNSARAAQAPFLLNAVQAVMKPERKDEGGQSDVQPQGWNRATLSLPLPARCGGHSTRGEPGQKRASENPSNEPVLP